ncbi:hypothetical protein [Chachezhania sediminis]|uniref:hypothetical protein n=1 Tax=Chachezhania sediminis TaxID=2599291 RepID=UPI00131CCF8F|nr:hypothetical protein [Chachezhania sediminis]
MRPALIGIGAAAIIAAFAAGAMFRARGDRVQDLQDHIETRERIDNALDRPDGCAWPDRLHGAC